MNIPLISGQIAKLHVKLETEDDFELYGGTTKAGFSITLERPEVKNEWLVTINESEVAGKPLTRFDVYVRQLSSGREWVVLSGKLLVSPRSAGVEADKLAPIEYNVTIPVVENAVDLTGAAIVTGIPGPRGWSAYEIAVLEGFEGSESEWLESMRQQTATLAVEQVTPMMARAETAADKSEREAAAAKTEQKTAAAHAKAAKESEVAAAGHNTAAAGEVTKAAAEVQKSAAEVEKAKQERETAAGHAAAAAKSAQAALTNQQGAEKAAQDAAQAQVGAKQAKTEAEAAKTEAQTAEGNAKASANAAAADKSAAEKAKQDAQAAQTKAEVYAGQLGDAALKSADNTFTGLNTFNGEVAGVLPWDFHAYSWCKTKEELWAACPDIEQRTVFCADLTNMEDVLQPNDGDGVLLPNNIKKACVYFEGDMKGKYTLGKGINYLYVYAPNATSYGRIRYMAHVTNAVIYVPNAKTDGASVLFDRMTVINLTLVCKNTKLDKWTIAGYGYAETSMKMLRCPLNILQTVDLADYKVLQDVPCGFPHATLINFQAAKLNKASVMAILNALQSYDTATMTKVPELTLGIDKTLDGDEEINAALLNAQEAVENGGKGWNVAVSGVTVTANPGAATLGLRRPIYAMKRADADGAYIDADGTRWSVRYGNTVLENWAANEELGYTEFPNLEDALAEWGLTEYVPEVPEETLTTTE